MHSLRIRNSVIPQESYLCTSLFQFSLTKSHASKCPGKCLPTVLMISDNFCVRMISPSRLLFINLKKKNSFSLQNYCIWSDDQTCISTGFQCKPLSIRAKTCWTRLRLVHKLKPVNDFNHHDTHTHYITITIYQGKKFCNLLQFWKLAYFLVFQVRNI